MLQRSRVTQRPVCLKKVEWSRISKSGSQRGLQIMNTTVVVAVTSSSSGDPPSQEGFAIGFGIFLALYFGTAMRYIYRNRHRSAIAILTCDTDSVTTVQSLRSAESESQPRQDRPRRPHGRSRNEVHSVHHVSKPRLAWIVVEQPNHSEVVLGTYTTVSPVLPF